MNTNKSSPGSRRLSRTLSGAVSAVLSLAAASAAQAGPQNGVVTSGSATISAPGANLTQIDQNSHSVSIDWQSFDVSASERVNFNQPSASSVALNRIFDQDPSQIQGSLTANGRVFLINPNGIIFGASARINVGSLVASSLDIADVDAVTGRYTFRTAAGQSGAISNSGQIVAADGGSVTLLGGSVSNDGLIVADYGSVNLGAGRAATLDFGGDGLVRFQVDEGLLSNASGASSAVNNAGEIRADGGQVLLTARAANDVIARAVNNDGVIRAARVENVGGRIRLVGPEGSVVNSGTLDATGVGADSTGGQVQVLGDQVELSGTSLVDVSGNAGGGTALIGGGFRGEDASVFNAQQTNVQAGAVIKADSMLSGDAGQVAVWSDGTTTFNGQILARATGSTGDGGYAEVSGHEHLRIGGHAWLQSANGSAGTLLLDPGSITIVDGPDAAPAGDEDIVNDLWIINQLNMAGGSLEVTTSQSKNGANEDLTVAAGADITWTSGNTLTLTGADSITLEAAAGPDAASNIANAAGGALFLDSSGDVALDGTINLTGDLTVDAGAGITQSAPLSVLDIDGMATFTAGNGESVLLNGAGNIFTNSVNIDASSGNLQHVTLRNSGAISLQALTIDGDLSVIAGGDITQLAALDVDGTSNFAAAGHLVTLDQANALSGAVSITAQDATLHNSTATTILGAVVVAGDPTSALTVTADGDITQSITGSLSVTGTSGTSTFTAAPDGSILLGNDANIFTGAVNFLASGGNLLDVTVHDSTDLEVGTAGLPLIIGDDLTASSGGVLTLQALMTAGDLTLQADDGITQTGAISVGGNLDWTAGGDIAQSAALAVTGTSTFAATGQSVTLDQNNTLTGAVSIAAHDATLHNSTTTTILGAVSIIGDPASDLTVTADGSITQSGLVSVGGDLDWTAGGDITQSAALAVTGTSTFTAAGQSVTLDQNNTLTGAVSITAHDATLHNSTAATALGAVSIIGDPTSDLTVTADGSITQSGLVSVGGDLDWTAGGDITQSAGGLLDVDGASIFSAAGQLVTLDQNNILTGAVSITAQAATLHNSTATTTLGAASIIGDPTSDLTVTADGTITQSGLVSVSGDLDWTAGGAITQSAALDVDGTSSFTAIGQSVTLSQANTLTGAVSITAQSATLNNSIATQLDALTIDTGNLIVTSVGAIAQSAGGLLDVDGTSSFTATGQSVTLNQTQANMLTGAVSITAQDATLNNSIATNLGTVTIAGLPAGGLSVTSEEAITQSGALNVAGLADFTTLNDLGAAITLTGTNSFGSVQAAVRNAANTIDAAADVQVHENNDTLLGDVRTAQSVSVVSTGAITAVTNSSVTAGTIDFSANGAIQLADVQAGNSMTLSSTAGISQSGAWSIGGASNFTAGAGQSISLGNTANAFGGTVNFAVSGGIGNLDNVTVSDSTDLDVQTLVIGGDLTVSSGAALSLQALTIGGDLIVDADAGITQSGTVSVGGNLDWSAGGDITQSAALNVTGISSFTAGAAQSVLLDQANTFNNAVSIAGNGGNLQDVTLRDTTAMDLQALTIDGDLTVTAGGTISQAGSLGIGGAAAFRTLNDAGAGITLDGTNSFGSVQAAVRNGADSANAAASIVIHESNDTVLGDVQTGSGQNVAIVSAGAIAALANTSIATSSVSLSAAADIGTTSAPLSLALSNGSISADSPGSIYLANSGGSTVVLDHLAAGGTGAIDFESDGNIQLSDVQAGSSVTLASTGGSILDDNVDGAGSQIVTDALSLTAAGAIGEAAGVGNGTLDLQAGSVSASAQSGAVYLDDADADINIRQVSAGGAVWIQSAGSILDDPSDAGAASIGSAAGGVQLTAVDNIGTVTDMLTRQGAPIAVDTNGGTLSAHVAGATGQINLDIADGSNPVAGAGAISAGGAGRLLIQSAGDMSLTSFSSAVSGFAEAGFSADGTLQLSALPGLLVGSFDTLLLRGGTDISSATRVLEIGADHLIFESGGQGGNITLNTSVDRLDASIGNGASLVVDDGSGDITLGTVTAGGDVSISARNILDDGDLNGVTRITAGDAVSLTASTGIGSEDGSGGGRIDTASGSVSVSSDAGPVYISHLGDAQVSGEARGGLIDIVAPTGDITVNGVLRASGPLTLTAGTNAAGANPAIAGNIALTGSAQSDGTVALSARGGGAITDASGTVTHLSAADADLTATRIGSQANRLNVDVGSLNATAPDGIYVDAANAIELRSITAQTVAIGAAGNIADDGDAQTRITADSATLSGSALGATGAGNELDTAVDSLSASASAGGIHIGELDDIELAAVNANGTGNDVVITASGAITDDGDDTTRVGGGSLTLTASAIGAAGAHGELDTQATSLTASASNGGVFIGEANDLQLRSVTADAGSDVAISAGGALTDDGNDATRVTGDNVLLSASTIGAADNHIDTAASALSATSTAGGIYIDERDAVTLAAVQASGTGNTVDLRTANNGNIIVQNVTTQGGAVNLAAGGTGSLNVTGAIESNNGVVNLTSGNALAVPGLSTGTGSVVLHTVNDLNVGTITAGSISITSDTGNVSLGTVNAGTGTASITANNGTINDGTETSLTAGGATLSARSIGSEDNPLNISVGTLTANTSAGGVFIDEANGLTVASITSAGGVNLTADGALIQDGGITSAGSAISLLADSIAMQPNATTSSDGGDITYIASGGDITLGALDAGTGRALTIAGDSVYSALGVGSAINNITAAQVEVRAGGLDNGPGEIGTAGSPLAISTPAGTTRSVFVVVPAVNGVQTITPWINYAGPSFSILLKGYSGSGGPLFFDPASAFTADTVLLNGESIVPLLNGRIAVNSDSLSAATQALASGVVNRVSVDWAAFDPDVSLFGTLDPPLRLPADQTDETEPQASLIPPGTTLVMTRHGWKLVPVLQQISMVL